MRAYYNDHEKYVCEWLRNLSAAELIAPGVVDDRDIKSVAPEDVRGATQAHWFAGIGTWSYALRLAGVPDDFRVWSASLPCQPWSQAGRGKGFDDERHLLPDFLRLVEHCRPQCVFGEQSSSPDGLEWLDALQTGFKSLGYTVGFAVLTSASVGAPHIRHRTYWVAYSEEFRWPAGWNGRPRDGLDEAWLEFERHGDAGLLADAYRARFEGKSGSGSVPGAQAEVATGLGGAHRAQHGGAVDELADADRERLEGERLLVRERGPLEDLPEAPRRGEADGVVDAAGLGRRQDRLHAAEGGGASSEREAALDGDAGAAHELADAVRAGRAERGTEPGSGPAAGSSGADGMGDAGRAGGGGFAGELLGAEGERRSGPRSGSSVHESRDPGEADRAARELGDAGREGLPEQLGEPGVARSAGGGDEGQAALGAGPPTGGFWRDAIWLYCRDGRYRPTQSRVESLADGSSRVVVAVPPLAKGVEGRVGQIKAYGNAINSLCAATFIRAFMESTQHLCG